MRIGNVIKIQEERKPRPREDRRAESVQRPRQVHLHHSSLKDPRLWAGVLLLAISVLLGQSMLARAGARTPAIVLKHDLSQGSVLRQQDLTFAQIAIPNEEVLLTDASQALGQTLTRTMVAGEIVTIHDVADGVSSDLRQVTIPLRAGHIPPVQYGDLVDIWVSASSSSLALPKPTHLVAERVLVSQVPDGMDPGTDSAITLAIPSSGVGTLVGAIQEGLLDVVVHSDIHGAQS